MNRNLYKRFSVGLSFGCKPEKYLKLVNTYHEYIYEIYFSPPLGDLYHTRPKEAQFQKPSEAVSSVLFEILHEAAKLDISLNLTLNRHTLNRDRIKAAVDFISSRISVNSVTTLKKYGFYVNELLPFVSLTCSYNEGIKTGSDFDKVIEDGLFNTIVLGNSTIRDFELFNYIKSRGRKVKLLLNNGCSFNCSYFCHPSSHCKEIFEKNIRNNISVEYLYSQQSILPFEFHKYYMDSDAVDYFKISCRPSSYRWLKNCLESYFFNINKPLIDKDKKNYHLWARLGVFTDYYENLNFDNITKYKNEIWGE